MTKKIRLILIVFALWSTSANARVVDVQMDAVGVPFLLDDHGHVWAFKEPLSLKNPFRVPNLNNIKKLAPYIALNADGQIFTWSLKNSSHVTGPDVEINADYTIPTQVEDLSGITDVIYTGGEATDGRFVVVKGGNQILSWTIHAAKAPPAIGVDGYGPKQVLYTGKKIKSIDATSAGIIVLFEDDTVLGLGLSETGQPRKDAQEKQVFFGAPQPVTAVYLTTFHTIILSADGRARFWGGCDIDGFGQSVGSKSVPAAKIGGVAGVESVIDNVKEVFPAINDNHTPDLFLKKDGSLWADFAPRPDKIENSFCRPDKKISESPIKISNITGPIRTIAGKYGSVGVNNLIALTTDGYIWVSQYASNGFIKSSINIKE